MEKRIKTTMIGSIDILEKEFKEELKDKEFLGRFLKVRKSILDLGNHQIYLHKKDRENEKRS